MRATTLLGALMLSASGFAEVTIENIDGGETVRYPVVILKGQTHEQGVRAGLEGQPLTLFPAFKNRYRAICELKPGKNFVIVKAGQDQVKIRLDYKPMKTPYRVQAVWVQASDESDGFTPNGVVPYGDYRSKLDVAMKLLQSFTAEAMHDAGYGRKTFPLETDINGKVMVKVVKLPKTGKEMRAMEAGAAWGYLYGVLGREIPGPNQRWAAFNSYIAFEDGKLAGHYALGGGQLAGFGAGTVGYWPASLAEVAKTFANRTPIDPKTSFEDSAYRETVWANVSTAFGATLHELGHTFGLPHSPDPLCVMSRGFDHFNRSFIAYEPPSKRNPNEIPVEDGMQTRWNPFFAARLNVNPWFQPDGSGGLRFDDTDGPKIEINGEDIIVTGKHGLRVVGADRDDTPPFWKEHKEAPKRLVLKLKETRAKMGEKTYRITAIDSEGNQTTIEDKL